MNHTRFTTEKINKFNLEQGYNKEVQENIKTSKREYHPRYKEQTPITIKENPSLMEIEPHISFPHNFEQWGDPSPLA